MSAFTRPLLALPNGQAQLLERIPLTIGGSDKMSERWLQAAIRTHT